MLVAGLVGASILFSADASKAAVPPSIRLEQPDSPTDIKSLNIAFVTLDIDDNPMTVVCEKKGPGEAGFTSFQTLSGIQNGGNSGTCDFTMPADGSYDFRASATSANGSDLSDVVTVILNSEAPGTPLNYERDGDSCDLTFTTADDGLTSKVELYRSKDNEFTADASTFAASVNIGPNAPGSLSDPLGNCDDYLYAIRAVSAAGIGSGFVGDEDVHVRTRTETDTDTVETIVRTGGGAIPVAAGGAIAGETAGAETEEGTVEGAQTPTDEGATEEGEEEGQVLGEETANGEGVSGAFKKHPYLYSLLGLLILYGLYYAYEKWTKKGGLKLPSDTPKKPTDTPPTDPSA